VFCNDLAGDLISPALDKLNERQQLSPGRFMEFCGQAAQRESHRVAERYTPSRHGAYRVTRILKATYEDDSFALVSTENTQKVVQLY
jgi:hypothetical protein